MRDVAESDWKLFKKMLPQWQERYMEKLIGQYVEMLNGDSEASSRFWALEERLNRDKCNCKRHSPQHNAPRDSQFAYRQRDRPRRP